MNKPEDDKPRDVSGREEAMAEMRRKQCLAGRDTSEPRDVSEREAKLAEMRRRNCLGY